MIRNSFPSLFKGLLVATIFTGTIANTVAAQTSAPPAPKEVSAKAPTNKNAAKIVIYSSNNCTYCDKAKALLDDRNIPYEVINVQWKKEEIDKMEAKTGKRSVPQILINDKHIGGYLALVAMNATGQLDSELNAQETSAPETNTNPQIEVVQVSDKK